MAYSSKRITPTQWGDVARKAGLIAPEFAHVHVCNATPEGKECAFKWDRHWLNNNGDCSCFPQLDMSGVQSKEQPVIFIVHRGSC